MESSPGSILVLDTILFLIETRQIIVKCFCNNDAGAAFLYIAQRGELSICKQTGNKIGPLSNPCCGDTMRHFVIRYYIYIGY